MTVRVYRWDDADAPTLTGQSNSVCNLLLSCLTGGYGTQDPAGWSWASQVANSAAMRNASGKCLTVQQTSGTARFYGSDDVNELTCQPTGNTYPAGSVLGAGLYMQVSTTSDATQRPWILIADEEAFFFWPGYNLTTAAGIGGSSTAQPTYFVGNIVSDLPLDAHTFMIIGSTGTAATTNYMAERSGGISGGQVAGHFIAGSLAQVAGSLNCGKASDQMYAGAIGGTVTPAWAYPAPSHGGMSLAPIRVVESGVGYRGRMPGMYHPLHTLPGACGDTFSGVGALAGKTFILLDIANGSTRGRLAIQTNGDWRA